MLQSVGFYFSPLRDADDVASLMEAGSLIPPSTPSRAERIVTYLKTKVRSLVVNETEVVELFDRMHAGSGGGERFEAVMVRLPPSEGQVIVTDRTACVICNGALLPAVANRGKKFEASPTLFSHNGAVGGCTMLWLKCAVCEARHYYSYAVGGNLLPEGCAHVYPDWKDLRQPSTLCLRVVCSLDTASSASIRTRRTRHSRRNTPPSV